MKKVLLIAIVIMGVIVCFTACKKTDSSDADTPTDKVVEINSETTTTKESATKIDEVIDFATTRPKEEPSTIKKNKTMKLSVPYYLIENAANGDVDKYAATYGFKISKVKDGYSTITMDGIDYSLLLSRIGMTTMKSIGEIIDSGEYPYMIRLADYSEDFSYMLFEVDTSKYKKVSKNTPYSAVADIIGLTGMYYQYFTVEEDNKCEVVFASSKTGKVVYTKTYTE